jgi:hypothetical protein
VASTAVDLRAYAAHSLMVLQFYERSLMMSISIDITGIFTYSAQVVNMMMPIVALSAGFGLGFGLVSKISNLFSRAL